ncbi:hypothetical protein [Sphingobacterium bambusae]|uniref:hypothetical protein n=1 Tax=Sphingobacterium bambusae TaxID=662858 RepID=UPI002A18C0FF|nr:hypothetical protein [Sphingobacterium bambusae]WPL48265.1 hypothetical protein SCB77_20155 [Sphingobacterium bambusae]
MVKKKHSIKPVNEIAAFRRQFAIVGAKLSIVTGSYVRNLIDSEGAYLYRQLPGVALNSGMHLGVVDALLKQNNARGIYSEILHPDTAAQLYRNHFRNSA